MLWFPAEAGRPPTQRLFQMSKLKRPYPSRGCEKVYSLYNWCLWGGQGRPLCQVWNDFGEQGEKTGPVRSYSQGWVSTWRQEEPLWFGSPTSTEGGGAGLSYQPVQMWGRSGRRMGEASKLSTSRKGVRLLITQSSNQTSKNNGIQQKTAGLYLQSAECPIASIKN